MYLVSDELRTISPEPVGGTIPPGDTVSGHLLVFHPDRPGELFVLPRDEEEIYKIGHGLEQALDWLCDSGVLSRPRSVRDFEPAVDRTLIERTVDRPFEEVREAVLGLSLHDQIAIDLRIAYSEEFDEDESDEEPETALQLLVKEFGGDIFLAGLDPMEAGRTSVMISHLPACRREKLDRLLSLLDGLDRRATR